MLCRCHRKSSPRRTYSLMEWIRQSENESASNNLSTPGLILTIINAWVITIHVHRWWCLQALCIDYRRCHVYQFFRENRFQLNNKGGRVRFRALLALNWTELVSSKSLLEVETVSCTKIYSCELRRPRCNARIFSISLELLMGPCLTITTVGGKVKYHRSAATD